jgi:hypothetical protein
VKPSTSVVVVVFVFCPHQEYFCGFDGVVEKFSDEIYHTYSEALIASNG